MGIIYCPNCGKKINEEDFFCPYCTFPIEIEEEEEIEEPEPAEQGGFGIAAFVISIVALAIEIVGHMINFYIESVGLIFLMHMFTNVLLIISFILGSIGMFSKKRKTGFAVCGQILSFILLLV